MARATLADQVLQAFHQACRDGRPEIADHLFAALEVMPEADLRCACRELQGATNGHKSLPEPTKSRRN